MAHTRGQGSAEFLVLTAIVLVVVMIVVVLTGGLPLASGDTAGSENQIYWRTVAFPYQIDNTVQINNTLLFALTNRDTERLVLRKITIGNVTADFGPGWVFRQQSTKNISIAGLQMCNETTYDSFEYNVSITYDSDNIGGKSQIGTKPIAGRCSFP